MGGVSNLVESWVASAEPTPWIGIARRRGNGAVCGGAWFDPIEAGLRDRVRGFIEETVEQEFAAALGRERYARSAGGKG